MADEGRHGPTLASLLAALARRPALWGTAVRQVRVLAARGWWRRTPFLPVPDPAYWRFRMETVYGVGGAHDSPSLVVPVRRGGRPVRGVLSISSQATVGEIVDYLTWCRQMRCLAR